MGVLVSYGNYLPRARHGPRVFQPSLSTYVIHSLFTPQLENKNKHPVHRAR